MERIDIHPTHTYGEFKMRAGRPLPSAPHVEGGINFSISSRHASSCTLVLLKSASRNRMAKSLSDDFGSETSLPWWCRTRLREH